MLGFFFWSWQESRKSRQPPIVIPIRCSVLLTDAHFKFPMLRLSQLERHECMKEHSKKTCQPHLLPKDAGLFQRG